MTTTIHPLQSTEPVRLYVAFELSRETWRIAASAGPGQAPRERRVSAGDWAALETELRRTKERCGLPADAPVWSCYEAGRDGFWVARGLAAHGIEVVVVDSSSIEVPRRARRTKTDKVDARKLLALLLRYAAGDRAVWKIVRVPDEAAEDRRHLHRTIATIKADRTRIINRLRGLCATQGVALPRHYTRRDLTRLLRWDGHALGAGLQIRLRRECEHLALVTQQLRDLEKQQQAMVEAGTTLAHRQARQLMRLRGIATTGAWVYATELFSWRQIRNGRQLGALTGLAPAPYQSGATRTDQGISRAGRAQWRALAVNLAWGWLRHQPRSALTRWYREHWGDSARGRRVGVVALARKLLVALWRYLETGQAPAGAELKTI